VKIKERSDGGKLSYAKSGNIYWEFLMLLSFYNSVTGLYEEEERGVA
jgi:hypothetical protein